MFRRFLSQSPPSRRASRRHALAAAPASAGNVAWSVSVGGPGFVVNAGGPAYWGTPLTRPAVRRAHRPYYAAPIVYAAPSSTARRSSILPLPLYVARRVVVAGARVGRSLPRLLTQVADAVDRAGGVVRNEQRTVRRDQHVRGRPQALSPWSHPSTKGW